MSEPQASCNRVWSWRGRPVFGRYGLCILFGHRWKPWGDRLDWWRCPRCNVMTITRYRERRPSWDRWRSR